ncbi:MAG: phenylalanine--tRNA ligase subunit alpha [Candidatus Omnitrophota bacterium]|nr:phenylalanine--tRNA ligase subunit alpha [Candidatus Omnitrophota bacterium]
MELDSFQEEALQALSGAKDSKALELLRVKYLGRKGALTERFAALKDPAQSPAEKSRLGQQLNEVKRRLEEALAERTVSLQTGPVPSRPKQDLTLPGHVPQAGRLHPLSQTLERILEIFQSLGFPAVQGPEVETEFNNFEALNIPAEHPSRENFDTFYLKTAVGTAPALLRSHTSPVQIRFMKSHPPPFQVVVPGRVYRPDAVDATHCFQFHQVEGLAVAPGLTFGDLKGVLASWAQGMFGSSARLRFRPHHFPFTEPSAEGDLACIFCSGSGCRVCGRKGWLEILGCGMVHPQVFKAVGYPAGTVGFAFGMGVERIAMLLHGVEDIRLFYENDLRFLRQFP